MYILKVPVKLIQTKLSTVCLPGTWTRYDAHTRKLEFKFEFIVLILHLNPAYFTG